MLVSGARTGETRHGGFAYLSGDVQLRHVMRQHADDLGHRRHFQRSSDDEYEIYEVPVVIHESVVEGGWEVLAEECDVRFHNSGNRNVVILVICAVVVALPFLPRTG